MMSLEQRYPVVLVCCGSFNPITVGHVKMFEIARSFLERTGKHIVVSGIVSPVHDSYKKNALISSTHRIAMCRAAVKNYAWLSVDTWESSQNDWVKIIKVLQHVSNKIKNDYGVVGPYSHPVCYKHDKYHRNTVTLQPNGKLINQLYDNRTSSSDNQSSNLCSSISDAQEDSLELNEASEPDETGVVFNRLTLNFKKACCVRPVPLALADNMVYGATYDLRRTRVMLLCGSDLMESFGVPGLWTDEDIEEIISVYGIVCIPRNMEGQENDGGELMRSSLDRLQKILRRVQGTIILVNDQSRAEIARVSSTKCRAALKFGELDNAKTFLNPDVFNYVTEKQLYVQVEESYD